MYERIFRVSFYDRIYTFGTDRILLRHNKCRLKNKFYYVS